MSELGNLKEIEALYRQLIDGWNAQSARGMAKLFTEQGVLIGFDGSLAIGPDPITQHLDPIFQDHPTPRFVSKIKEVRFLTSDAAMLRAAAGMVPRGKTDIIPEVNAHHTLIAVKGKNEGIWRIELFQNTPAQFHGRPELVEQMTEELRELLP